MDWDDSYDEDWDDALEYENRDYDYDGHGGSMSSENSSDGVDPMDTTNPVSSFLFLSDDAQDEIEGSGRKRMKCTACGHRFVGDAFDPCPNCESFLTEEEKTCH